MLAAESLPTMSTLVAETKIGKLVDMSKRSPVALTQLGKPLAVLMSYHDYTQQRYQLHQLQSQLHPLRGKEAVLAFEQATTPIDAHAAQLGLTEIALQALLIEQ